MTAIGGEPWARLPEVVRAEVLATMAPLGAVVAPHVSALLGWTFTAAQLQAVRVPLVLVYGANSFSFQSHIAARFAELRPDVEQVVVDGAGHNVHVDQPGAAARLVERFCRGSAPAN